MDVYFVLKFTSNLRRLEFGLFQLGNQLVRSEKSMKIDVLKKRLDRNRPMTSVTIRIPEDVVEELKRIALAARLQKFWLCCKN